MPERNEADRTEPWQPAQKARLLGELIGIARAVDGNEHLIRPSTDDLLRRGLCAAGDPGTDAPLLEELPQAAQEEKRAIVPNCFACASPCGRTSAYDMAQLETEPADVKAVKLQLLQELFAAAREDVSAKALYPPLFAVGLEGVSAEELRPFLTELKTQRCAE